MNDFNEEFYIKLDHMVHYLQYIKFVSTMDTAYWNQHKTLLSNTLKEHFAQAINATGISFEESFPELPTPEIKQQVLPPIKNNPEKYQTPYFSIAKRLKMIFIKDGEENRVNLHELLEKESPNKQNFGTITAGLSKRICNIYKTRHKQAPKYEIIQFPIPDTNSFRSVQTPIYPESEFNDWIDHFILYQGFNLNNKCYNYTNRLPYKEVQRIKKAYSNPQAVFTI